MLVRLLARSPVNFAHVGGWPAHGPRPSSQEFEPTLIIEENFWESPPQGKFSLSFSWEQKGAAKESEGQVIAKANDGGNGKPKRKTKDPAKASLPGKRAPQPQLVKERPFRARYPWDKWLCEDGGMVFERGKQFFCTASSFRQAAIVWCWWHEGWKIQTQVREDKVFLKVLARPPAEPQPPTSASLFPDAPAKNGKAPRGKAK